MTYPTTGRLLRMTAGRLAIRSLAVLAAVAVGAVGAAIAVMLSQLGAKGLIVAAVGVAVVVFVAVIGRPREVLFAAYIVALTYNRAYFSFDGVLGASGSQGLYWIPADPLLALLLATSFVDSRDGRQVAVARGSFASALMPILPFLAVCCLSSLIALRPDWAFNDTLRVMKFAIVLGWLCQYMTPSLWTTGVATFAAVIVVQSAFGIVQVLLKGQASMLAMFGLATQVASVANDIENRARGTMGHPNILAPYLLLFAPAAFGVALFARNRWVVLAGLVVTALAAGAIFATKSRAPIVIVAAVLPLVAAIAVWLRVLAPRVALGGAVLVSAILVVVLTPMLTAVTERVVGDFAASVKFRADYNDAALAIWSDYPLLGIGPNNVNVELGRHAPLMAKVVADADKYRDLGNTRGPTVHNVYFLVLAETGLIGLAAFLFLLTMTLIRALRAAVLTEGAVRGLCIGVAVGLVGTSIQQTVDFSLWYDSAWYSLAVTLALMTTAPEVAAARSGATARFGAGAFNSARW